MQEGLVQLNVKIPRNLKKLMRQYIAMNAHKDISEFTRDALREKIQRDAPDLYHTLFQMKKKKED